LAFALQQSCPKSREFLAKKQNSLSSAFAFWTCLNQAAAR
jgi:hypothetical protein